MYKIRKPVNLILAMTKSGGIGYKGRLPWNSLPDDMKRFKQITTTTVNPLCINAVIMGRKTFDSIGRPLPKRVNYVLSRKPETLKQYLNVEYSNNLINAIASANENPMVERVFVIGGAEIYNETLELQSTNDLLTTSFITIVNGDYELRVDTSVNYNLLKALHYCTESPVLTGSNGEQFYEWQPKNNGEELYLNLLRKILKTGESRIDRTGVGTTGLFGERLEFNINRTIPFLTTKKLAWKTMIKELLWFISGDTNNANLQAQGVHIWDGNSSRKYLDNVGLANYPTGCLGPVYGHQWRHWGAEYTDCNRDYTGAGIDQLETIIKLIKTDPTSRRIIMTAWNPSDLDKMALPPCHLLVQWYVRSGKYLDCQVYQRSVDAFLGLPFNISSYSVLTFMIAHLTNLQPGRLVHTMGDVHVYNNHFDAVREQLGRQPFQFPTLDIIEQERIKTINDFKLPNFVINNYKCHSAIKAPMAV